MRKLDWEKQYTARKAKQDFEKLSVDAKEVSPIELSPEWQELREKLLLLRDEVFEEYNLDVADSLGYVFDIAYGLRCYELLNEKIGFTSRVASGDDIWRYLSIRVIPDVVHARHGLNKDYYYANGRRIWLKSIWWYINLSWCGSPSKTFEIIEGNSTDTIMQVVERPGLGYYIEVYRAIMRKYKNYNDRALFRRIFKLNTARLLTTSPELVEGGIEGYVNELFKAAEN